MRRMRPMVSLFHGSFLAGPRGKGSHPGHPSTISHPPVALCLLCPACSRPVCFLCASYTDESTDKVPFPSHMEGEPKKPHIVTSRWSCKTVATGIVWMAMAADLQISRETIKASSSHRPNTRPAQCRVCSQCPAPKAPSIESKRPRPGWKSREGNWGETGVRAWLRGGKLSKACRWSEVRIS